jgi:hypothetical protein
MVEEDTKKTDEMAAMIEKIEKSKAPAPAIAPKSMVAVAPAPGRIGFQTRQLSKGQRRHVRRQKQAGEPKATDRRQ